MRAGIPPADVLLGATSRAAKFFHPSADYGTIEPGKIADLVVVAGDPLVDIAATSRIMHVLQRGRLVTRHVP